MIFLLSAGRDGRLIGRAVSALLLFIFICLSHKAADRSLAFDSSYWVWHRATPLTPDEVEGLERQHVKRLFWEVGEVASKMGDGDGLANRSRVRPETRAGCTSSPSSRSFRTKR